MRTGNLDRRIQFVRARLIDDGYQERFGPFEPIGGLVWASKQEVKDGERWSAGGVGVNVVMRFVVRWSSFTASITRSDRVRFGGEDYGIAGIKEIGRREGLEFTVTLT